MKENFTIEKLSYLAGIIDGEGSIAIEIQSKDERWGRKVDYYSLRLLVTNTNLALLNWIKSNFGGNITILKTYPNRRQCYRWSIFSHQASAILFQCEQYMIVKKAHVGVFLKFAETMSKANVRLTDELLEFRKDLYLKLKYINKTY